MKCYYQNSRGKKINLMRSPYRLITGNFFDYEWDEIAYSGKIYGFSRKTFEKELKLDVFCSEAEFMDNMNHLESIFAEDVVNTTPGKLYVNGDYLTCYVKGDKKEEWEAGIYTIVTLTIVTDCPFWINEMPKQFLKKKSEEEIFESKNVFDGKWMIGGYYVSNGLYGEISNSVVTQNKMVCKGGDRIKVILDKEVSEMIITYWSEDGTYIATYSKANKVKEFVAVAPAESRAFAVRLTNPELTCENAGIAKIVLNLSLGGGKNLNYPFNYPFNYTVSDRGSETWQVEHIKPLPFYLIVYGPVTNPRILINNHPYEVFTTLETNEYMTIDSRTHKVLKHASNGTVINLYNNRRTEQSIFEPLSPGILSFNWQGTFGFDITIYVERNEPRWS